MPDNICKNIIALWKAAIENHTEEEKTDGSPRIEYSL